MMSHELTPSVVETDVQYTLKKYLEQALDLVYQTKYGSDGIGYSEKNKLRLICEFKYDVDLTKQIEICKIVAQIIGYLKKNVDDDPRKVPQVAIGADINEAFVISVKDIINYTTMDYNWSLSPCSLWKDTTLMEDLYKDENIQKIFVYKLDNDFKSLIQKIKSISIGVNVPRVLNERNIDKVFEYFTKNISFSKNGKKLKDNDMVNLFASIMLHPETAIMVDLKGRGLLYTPLFKGPLSIGNLHKYKSFVGEFSRTYTLKQKYKFTGILDRLIFDTTRRKQGEFFTPTEWVFKANEYIESVYGKNWKNEYVVWDPAWGTGNLTRDFKFSELYVSTLNQSDIDTAEQMGYNPEANKFKFDFLNDDYNELPLNLRKVIESGRKIIVLMNPPYGTSSTSINNHKTLTSKTNINLEMLENNIGRSSQQLYAQFLYRLHKMGIKNICLFCKPNFFTSAGFIEFREKVWKDFEFQKGFVMNASEFDKVKKWPLTFSIWKNNK